MRTALDLVRAVDNLLLFQQIERVTGVRYATDDDVIHVRRATNRFLGIEPGNRRVVR